MLNRIFCFLFAIGLLSSCQVNHKKLISEVGPKAKQGMVVSAHPLASKVGNDILRQGGNAVDAAIAVQFALAVTYPRAGNIGGGGFAVIHLADGRQSTLDFREMAPEAAHKDMYLDKAGNVISRLSLDGHKAAGVPGAVDGMFKLHARYGSLPMHKLIQPSIDLAKNGFALTKGGAGVINRFQKEFKKYNDGKNSPFIKATPYGEGEMIKIPELAKTLELIRDNGRDGFYKGQVADLIVDEMKQGNGIITHSDLENYYSVWRKPVRGTYKDYDIISMPPPSSGGIALIQLLKASEKYPLATYGFNSPQAIHHMVEMEKRVYADRATYLGDSDFVEVPIDNLISDEYLAERMANISSDKVTPSQEIKEGKVLKIESIETTHFSVVDGSGNAVAVTTTVNSYFGNKVYVKGAGFFLNNEMDDFSVKPGEPNQFGLIGNEANAIAPGKRMLSSMTPTIVLKDGQVRMVVGSPGGSTIITSVYQTILNHLEHGMSMQGAVNAKRFHHQWLPDVILTESNALSKKTIRDLTKMGYKIDNRGVIGNVNAILVHPDGTIEGGPDKYRGDSSASYH